MAENHELISTIYEGWHTYQNLMTEAIGQLEADQLLSKG